MAVNVSDTVKPRAKMTKTNKNSVKSKKKLLIVAQEIKLAKILAGNNKTLRDRTLKRLKKWFDARESQLPFNEDDFMRIWKGLYYYMWMSDKPLPQEECANNIAKLVDFKNAETSLLFFKCFLKTMCNEWFGIDNLRLDKFLMLVRRVLRQTLYVLQQTEWEFQYLTTLQDILDDTVFNVDSDVPLSLSMHVTEIYLEEIAKVSKGDISEDQVLELLRPFAWQLARSKDARLGQHIKFHIFKYLMRQSDAGIEYQERFNAWRQLGYPTGRIEAMEKIELDNDEDMEEPDEQLEQLEDTALDPRAGKVHVELPQLKFNSIKIAEMLDELRFKPTTNTKTRRVLNILADQFRQLAKGDYPLGLKKVDTQFVDEGASTKIKNSLRRLQNFQQKLLGDSKKAKQARLKSRKIKDIVKQELEKYKNVKGAAPAGSMEEFIIRSEEGIWTPALVKNVTKSTVPSKNQVSPPDSKKRKSESKIHEPVKRFRRNSGIWEVDELELTCSPSSSSANGNDLALNTPKNKIHKRARKKNAIENLSPIIEASVNNTNNGNIKKAKTLKKRIETTPLQAVFEKSTPLKSTVKKESTPKSMVKNPFSSPSSSTKKVKIALNLNRSQDHKDYHRSLAISPAIPYDASKKPNKPLLKARNSLPNVINPFYRH